MRKRTSIIGLGLALPLLMTACSSSTDTGSSTSSAAGGTTEVSYWLWDSAQLPAYQKCADAFTAANPTIKIKVEQFGWDDYWTKITTGFVSGTAPDVFTDHLSKYPTFVQQAQLVALDDNIAKDGVKTDIYQPGLAELWVGSDGKRYGLPKDWDTIAHFYNTALTDAAGITKEQLDSWEWNPTDGGTFEKIIAHLSVDSAGVRGDEAGFNKDDVKTYGLGLTGSGGSFGQTQWSMYAGSNGFTATDKPWATKYNYDSPKFQETIKWWQSLIGKGYMPPLEKTVGVSGNDQFGAGNYAVLAEGSWNTGALTSMNGVKAGIAPNPIGPTGKSSSMFNGLADAIWVGSKHQAEAWQWVKYLASADCQNTVGDAAVVFPAIPSATDKAIAAFKAKGVDVTGFTSQVANKTTFGPPVTDHAAEISALMGPAMDAVMQGSADVSSLTEINDQINALFG